MFPSVGTRIDRLCQTSCEMEHNQLANDICMKLPGEHARALIARNVRLTPRGSRLLARGSVVCSVGVPVRLRGLKVFMGPKLSKEWQWQ